MVPNRRTLREWHGSPPDLIRMIKEKDNDSIRRWVPRLSLNHLRQQGTNGVHVFHAAAESGNAIALRMLIDAFTDRLRCEMPENKVVTALRKELNVKCEGITALFQGLVSENYECCFLLLKAGASLLRISAQERNDEFSQLFWNALYSIQTSGQPNPSIITMLQCLSTKGRPDRPTCIFTGITAFERMVDAHNNLCFGIEETDAVISFVKHILRLWPNMQLEHQYDVLYKASRCPRLFHLLWMYFKDNGQLTSEILKKQSYRNRSLLMHVVISSDVDTISLVLEADVDVIRLQTQERYITLYSLMLGGPEAIDDCAVDCPYNKELSLDDEEKESSDEDEEILGDELSLFDDNDDDDDNVNWLTRAMLNCAPTGDYLLCPLMVAMMQRNTAVVWLMLDKFPALWDSRWPVLLECCRLSESAAWFVRVVCHQARRGKCGRMMLARYWDLDWDVHPTDLDFAPPTVMDAAILTLNNRLPVSFMCRHFSRLFYSAGRRERRPSVALTKVLDRLSDDGPAVASLVRRLRIPWHGDPTAAESSIFMACLRSRAALAAAVSRGFRPAVSWSDESGGGGVTLTALRKAVEAAESPRVAWAVVTVLLEGDARLEQETPASCTEYRPMPLKWRAVAEVRAALEERGYRSEKQMEAELKRRRLPPVLVDLCLLRDVHLYLI